jgi:hypothetical protein
LGKKELREKKLVNFKKKVYPKKDRIKPIR